jgi:hypothetical protein
MKASSAALGLLLILVAGGFVSCAPPASEGGPAGPDGASGDRWAELSSLPFPEHYPTREAADRLHDEMLFQRASQVTLWSLPAMTLWAMKKGSEAHFGAGSNVLVIWKDRLSAETIVSTPNSDVIYAMGYIDLKADGPVVVEVPPKLQGILDDFWHRPLCDVGFVGPDKGKGGKYLLLPPTTRVRLRTATSPSGARPTTSSCSGGRSGTRRRAMPPRRSPSWSRPGSTRSPGRTTLRR